MNEKLDGVDLSAALVQPTTVKGRTIIQIDAKDFAVINSEWRYIKRTNADEELYNVSEDKHE